MKKELIFFVCSIHHTHITCLYKYIIMKEYNDPISIMSISMEQHFLLLKGLENGSNNCEFLCYQYDLLNACMRC